MGHISMVTFPGQRLLLFLSLLIPLTISQRPIAAKWSTSTIGPDGPWQAVEAALGDGSTISLYPGNIYSSWVITTEYCNLNRSSDGCFASVAGTYNKAQGEQLGTGSNGHINFSPDIQGFSPGLNVQGPKAEQWVDNMDVGMLVPNVSMALFEDQMLAYPSGQWYPAFAGCLGLGGNGQTKQVFTINDLSSVNASLIPGALWKSNEIPSNSFGLHIGSVTSNTPGSLWWGGYDQSRITGDVLFSDISKKDSEADFNTILRDISIEVVDGSSPFDFQGQSQKGLLSSDSKASLSVLVNGCSPYLSLPKSTCDRITEYLPVRYDSDLGLYLWNTQSPSYQRIVSSASALAFTLQSESAENSEVTIRVPFAHLNLTLNKPLAEEPTPYFPCFTGAPADSYVLGRAFMQDAFLGANWGAQAWWLAQAPGPNFARSSSATPIREDDATIKGGSEDWKATWDGIWRVLSDGDVDGSRDGNSENRTQSTSTEPAQATNSPSSELPRDEGLSSGATAGIAVGASVVGLALVGGLWLLWARRRKASTQPQESSAHQTQIIQTQYGRSELEGEGHGDEPGYSKYRYMRKPFADTVTGIHGGELYGRPNDGETQAQNSRYELP